MAEAAICLVGSGTYSYVYTRPTTPQEQERHWGDKVAIKCSIPGSRSSKQALENEIEIYKWLNSGCSFVHRSPMALGLLPILEHGTNEGEEDKEFTFMTIPYIKTTLWKFIDEYYYHDRHICWIMFQILRSLAFIHNDNVIHGDLKPTNVLIDVSNEHRCYIIDFSSSEFKDNLRESLQTLQYRAPEVLFGQKRSYSEKIDIFSAGLIMLDLIFRRSITSSLAKERHPEIKQEEIGPFRQYAILSEIHQHYLRKGKHYIQARVGKDGYKLLYGLLRWKPKMRLSAMEAMEYSYLK